MPTDLPGTFLDSLGEELPWAIELHETPEPSHAEHGTANRRIDHRQGDLMP
jgi:hypothetical protein